LATAGIGCGIGALLAIVFRPSLYPTYVEGIAYLLIAKLDFRGIPGYYAGRVLHPLVVRAVAHAFHAARAFTVGVTILRDKCIQ